MSETLEIAVKELSNEELIGKLCTMYSLYPIEEMTTVLWKEANSRLSRIAALEAQNKKLVEALGNLMNRLDDHFGGQSKSYDWKEQAEARALLSEVTQ